jgi:hypothetical protein
MFLLIASVATVSHAQALPDLLPAMPMGSSLSAPLPAVSQSVPVYSSFAAANATIYLDFRGDNTSSWGVYNPGVTPAYSIDDDIDHFSEQELSNIHEIWARVSEAFSPFNINVTTAAAPQNLVKNRDARVVIGGDGKNGQDSYWAGSRAGGIGYIGGFVDADPSSVYVFPGNLGNGTPKYSAMAAAHEVGHLFGLAHQSTYNGLGIRTSEYNPGTSERAPFMGVSYLATRGVWYYGQSVSAFSFQNDVDVISSLNNGFGYRADDHGNSVNAATAMTRVGNSLFASGIIEKIADVDFFSFTVGEESTALFSVTGAEYGAMLDPSLALYTLDGKLLDLVATTSLTETLSATLLPGTYDLAVLSAGAPGDIGQFTLTGAVAAIPEPACLAAALIPLALLRRRRR